MIKIVCAWCDKTVKEGVEGAPVSHLICPSCYKKEMRRLKAQLANASENNQAKPKKPRKKFRHPSEGD